MCNKLTQPTTIMCAAGEAGRRRPPHMYKAVMCEFAKAVSEQPQAVLCRCHVVIYTSWLIDKVDISSVLVTGCPFHAHGACSCNPYAACLSSLHVRMAHFLHPAASQRTARPSCPTRDTLESLGESQPSKPTAKGMVLSDCVCLCCIFCPAGLPAGRRLHLRTQRPGVLAAPRQVSTAAARAACCALNPGSKLLCACC